MAIDREMLQNALAMSEGRRLPGEAGVTSMLLDNPDFARPSYQLPPTTLSLEGVETASRLGVRRPRGLPPREGELEQELSDLEGYGIRSIRPDLLVRDQEEEISRLFDLAGMDALDYMKQSQQVSEEEKKDVEDKVSKVLDNVENDEEQATKAVAAAGLADSDNSIDEVNESYKLFDNMIEEGGLPAVQRFVAAYLAPDQQKHQSQRGHYPQRCSGFLYKQNQETGDKQCLKPKRQLVCTCLKKNKDNALKWQG